MRSFPADNGGFQHEDANAELAFSADGSMLATTGNDGTLKVFDQVSGDLLRACRGPLGRSDLRSAPTVRWPPPLVRLGPRRSGDDTGREPVHPAGPVLSGAGGRERNRVEPRRLTVAVASGGPPGVVWVTDIATGDVRELTKPGPYGFTSVAWSPDGKYLAAGGWDAVVPVWNARKGCASS